MSQPSTVHLSKSTLSYKSVLEKLPETSLNSSNENIIAFPMCIKTNGQTVGVFCKFHRSIPCTKDSEHVSLTDDEWLGGGSTRVILQSGLSSIPDGSIPDR